MKKEQRHSTFKTQREVLEYLHENGYKISRSGLQKHVSNRSLIMTAGTFHRGVVDEYAQWYLRKVSSGETQKQSIKNDLQTRKMLAEIRPGRQRREDHSINSWRQSTAFSAAGTAKKSYAKNFQLKRTSTKYGMISCNCLKSFFNRVLLCDITIASHVKTNGG